METLPISGEFEFYWHSWETIGDPVYIWGPRGWRIQFPEGFPFDSRYGGYGTYRFVLLLPDSLNQIGLYLPPQHSAYTLWIDGQKVATNGTVGSAPDVYKGEWKPQVIRVSVKKPTMMCVLQIADFSMNTGGYFYPIRIGLPDTVEGRHKVRATSELIAFGVLVFVGLYCLLMYIAERKVHTLLFLGMASILFALRTITHGEMVYTSFFTVDIEGINKVRYLTLFLLPLVLWGFFRQLHRLSFSRNGPVQDHEGRWLRAVDIIMGILSGGGVLVTLTTPARCCPHTFDFPSVCGNPFYFDSLPSGSRNPATQCTRLDPPNRIYRISSYRSEGSAHCFPSIVGQFLL